MNIIIWILIIGISIFGFIGWILFLVQRFMNQNIRWLPPAFTAYDIDRIVKRLDEHYALITELIDKISVTQEDENTSQLLYPKNEG